MPVNREKTKAEFKKNLMAVFTLGLSDIPRGAWGSTFDGAKDAHRGMSFEDNGFVSFIFRCLWFLLFGAILMAVFFIKNLFMLIVNGLYLLFSRD